MTNIQKWRTIAIGPFLTNVHKVSHLGNAFDRLKKRFLLLSTHLEVFDKVSAWSIKVVFNRTFVVSRHYNNVLDTSVDKLFNNILDNRLVYNRKHFLGHGLRLRKESSSKSSSRYDGFSYLLHIYVLFLLYFVLSYAQIGLEAVTPEA